MTISFHYIIPTQSDMSSKDYSLTQINQAAECCGRRLCTHLERGAADEEANVGGRAGW